MPHNKGKTDPPTEKLIPGPTIAPLADLLTWVEAHATNSSGQRRLLRLPVVVAPPESDDMIFANRYFIGVEVDLPEAERVYLQLDDGTMGISLAERVRVMDLSDSRVLWIEGYWGALITLPGSGDPTDKIFDVRKVEKWTGDLRGGNKKAHIYHAQ